MKETEVQQTLVNRTPGEIFLETNRRDPGTPFSQMRTQKSQRLEAGPTEKSELCAEVVKVYRPLWSVDN